MTDRLELALRDLAEAVEFPPTPDLAPAVARRLAEGRAARSQNTWQRALLLAAASTLVLVATAAALSLALPGLRILPVASVPAEPSSLGDGLSLGHAASAADADGFSVGDLGSPDAVFVAREGEVVTLVYAANDALPEMAQSGIGLLVQRLEGDLEQVMIEKLVEEVGARVISVTVDGAPGFWISGPPHLVRYLDLTGRERSEMTRLAGDTLVWQAGNALYRMESGVGMVETIRLAESIEE